MVYSLSKREPAHIMPITSALSVRGEPDWASMQQTIEIPLVNRRWYTAHLVELICLLPVTTCPKRSGSGMWRRSMPLLSMAMATLWSALKPAARRPAD